MERIIFFIRIYMLQQTCPLSVFKVMTKVVLRGVFVLNFYITHSSGIIYELAKHPPFRKGLFSRLVSEDEESTVKILV
jgi:hypothetical protein